MRHLLPCSVSWGLLLGLALLLGGGPSRAAEGPEAAASAPSSSAAADEWNDEFDDLEDDFEDEADNTELIPDPLEPLNRLIFTFNDRLYFYFLKPVARGWRVLPRPMRTSLSRFYSNIQTPIRFVNCGLQLKLRDAGSEALRFGINSTIGILGLFDPARKFWGLRKKDEDLGQSLGYYGVGPGFYVVLPFFGPSSLRDGVGLLLDTLYLDPIYVFISDFPVRVAVRGVDTVNFLSLDKDTYESIKRDALDPYSFLKNAYAQQRQGKIRR